MFRDKALVFEIKIVILHSTKTFWLMDTLFLLQFACFLFMILNAGILIVSRLHVRWVNKRYERSRKLIIAAMLGMAGQYLLQMVFGLRASGDDLGALVNIFIYTPCFTLITLGIYNIIAPHAHFRQMNLVCGVQYAAIVGTFLLGFYSKKSIHIGWWLYLMLAFYTVNTVYCVIKIFIEMMRRKKMLEKMSGTDLLPYVRYSYASLFNVCFVSVIMPFVILNTPLLYVIGPLGLCALFFFIMTFVALVNSYTPSDELLDKEDDNEESDEKTDDSETSKSEEDNNPTASTAEGGTQSKPTELTKERTEHIKAMLDRWCRKQGYKDSSANMMTLSLAIGVSKDELTLYFDQCLNSTFRVWLSDIRFDAAKAMMIKHPDYSNDIISTECGFSSRTHLYRVFKQRVSCTPTVWRENNKL